MTFGILEFKLLLLLGVANVAPIAAWRLLGKRWNHSLDGGWRLPDGQPLFGPSKTRRGIIASMLLTPLAAVLLHFSMITGLIIAAGAMVGDLFSSFIKRRFKQPVSSMAPLLDQIPESLLPLLLLQQYYALTWTQMISIVLAFIIAEVLLSRLLYRFGLRKRPY